VIGDTLTRNTQVLPGGAVASKRQLAGQFYGFRLGPYLEIPLCQRVAVELGAGLAVGVVDSEFTYSDRVTMAGVTSTQGGGDSSSDVLAGAYGQVQLAWQFSRRVSLATGAQFQYLPDFKQQAGPKEAQLELGQSVFYTLGLRLHF